MVRTWRRRLEARPPGARGGGPAVRLVLGRDSLHAGDDPEPADLEVGERTSAADVVRWTAAQGFLPGGSGAWVLHLGGSRVRTDERLRWLSPVDGGHSRAVVVVDGRTPRSGAPGPWMATALSSQVLTPLRQLVWLPADERGTVTATWLHSAYGTRVPALTFPAGAVLER